jgi:hypothetical protein
MELVTKERKRRPATATVNYKCRNMYLNVLASQMVGIASNCRVNFYIAGKSLYIQPDVKGEFTVTCSNGYSVIHIGALMKRIGNPKENVRYTVKVYEDKYKLTPIKN